MKKVHLAFSVAIVAMLEVRRFSAILITCLLALFAMSAHAQRQPVPVIDHPNESWSRADSKEWSADEVKQKIRDAVQDHKTEGYAWRVEPASDGKLVATLYVRNKHEVRVLIGNTNANFSVFYQSSINMKAKQTPEGWVIHPFYNRWVADLVRTIKDQLGRT